MPNKNYVKGRRKEYHICYKLKKKGYDIIQRSAGSHSPIDIWAVRKEDRKILLVQCKPKDMTEQQQEKLLEENAWLNSLGGEVKGWKVEFVIK